MWTTICFVSKSEFLSYTSASVSQGKFISTKPTDHASGPALLGKEPGISKVDSNNRYNSRQSTVKKREEMSSKQDKEPQITKEDKDANAVLKLKEKLKASEDEKKALKKLNSDIKAARKTELDAAVTKAELKAASKLDGLLKQLDTTQKTLSNANCKIKNLEDTAGKFVAQSTSRTTVLAETRKTETASSLATNKSSETIANDYKALAMLVGSTNATIEISRIQAESSIQLAKMDEIKKLEVLLTIVFLRFHPMF